ncbi:MAG: hypothetical protein IH843_06580 [Thaumarchaeota archaeon]|nr:hypothetical protein [Nitrososphaerota archaeon]
MELDGRISNKLLVGGIFAVLIFGLVGSQQAMAGNGFDLSIDKCVTSVESLVDEVGERCRVIEAGVGSLLIREEGQTGFFRIDANSFIGPGVQDLKVLSSLQGSGA